MITREEIEYVSAEQEVHPSDVERDYVFGWLLAGLFGEGSYADKLTLKGGNALRKAYFPGTRFSGDLDFSTPSALDADDLLAELNRVCGLIESRTAVKFELDQNRLAQVQQVRRDKTEYKYKLYFHDFYGTDSNIVISVRVGATEFDRLYLPVQERNLIHPYSDAAACTARLRVVKLEEALADKLKCLLQRRSSFDLYDLIHATFISRDIELNRRELVMTFLRKTIFEPSPHVARNLLLGVPFDLMRRFWDEKISCPSASRLDFDEALGKFRGLVDDLFAGFAYRRGAEVSFFPAELRNLIMEAGQKQVLLRLMYHGVPRLVEPYSLSFKRRKSDGFGQEYFYAYDCTGGRSSGPGLKTFLNYDIQALQLTEQPFTPRYEIEVAKAGEIHGRVTFGGGRRTGAYSSFRPRMPAVQPRYHIECSYCGRKFPRQTRNTALRKHNDRYGNQCYGRRGSIV